MENIIKAFMGTFFTLLIAALGMGIISASIESRAAENAMTRYCRSIESSHFDKNVIDACQSDAAQSGRMLEVELGKRSGESISSYGWAVLSYEYRIPVIGFSKKEKICSDLR